MRSVHRHNEGFCGFRTSTPLRGPKPAWNRRYPRDTVCTARSAPHRFAGTFDADGASPGSLKIVVSPVRVWVSPFLKKPACGLVLRRLSGRLGRALEGRSCARGPFQVLNLRVVEGLAPRMALCSRRWGARCWARLSHKPVGEKLGYARCDGCARQWERPGRAERATREPRPSAFSTPPLVRLGGLE
jgi:hypothetical protein